MLIPAGTTIAHVHLRVRDVAKVSFFYGQLLGFREVMRDESTIAFSSTGQLPIQILLTENPLAPPRPQRSVGLFHTAIRFPNREEFAKTLAHVFEYGYPIQGAADHAVSEAIYLADPEGNGVELCCDRPKETWRLSDGEIVMVTESLDIKSLLSLAEGKTRKGIHPLTDIGHVHLNVSSLIKAEEFYNTRLGFDVTTRAYPGALFLSAGGYHHHIGANIWSSRNAVPADEQSAGLISFGIGIPKQNWLSVINELAKTDTSLHESTNIAGERSVKLRDLDAIGVEFLQSEADQGVNPVH